MADNCGSNDTPKSMEDSLKAMRDAHEAVARYRVYLRDWTKPKRAQVTEIERGLTYREACARRDQLNDELKATGKDRFGDPLYGAELTNGWDCMSDFARAQNISLGKGPKDFNR